MNRVLFDKYGIRYDETHDFVSSIAKTNSCADPAAVCRFFPSLFVNGEVFRGAHDLFKTARAEVDLDMDLLYDSKRFRNCKNLSLSLICGRITDLFTISSPFLLIPFALVALKDNKCIKIIDHIKTTIKTTKFTVPVYEESHIFDPFDDENLMFDPDNEHINHWADFSFSTVTRNGMFCYT